MFSTTLHGIVGLSVTAYVQFIRCPRVDTELFSRRRRLGYL